MTAQLWWFVARSSGIVAWALVTASVLWGLALSTRVLGPKPRPNWLLDLHRFLGGLAVTFTGIHLVALLLDTYTSFGLLQFLVPFTSAYRPVAVAWGVVGLYLLAAVEVTSLLRNRLSKRVWHATHLLSFPLFILSTIHGLTAGTDATGRPLFLSMIAASVAVVALTVARIDGARRRPATGGAGPVRPRVPAEPRARAATAGATTPPPVLATVPVRPQPSRPSQPTR